MKTIKMTELQKQIGVLSAAAILFFLIGIWLVIAPSILKMAQIRREIHQVSQKKEAVQKIQDFEAKTDIMQSRLDLVSEKNLVLSHLATLANRQKLEVESVLPDILATESQGFYQDFVIQVRASGGFKQLIGFFGAIEKMTPPIAVVDMKLINQSSRGRGSTRVRSPLSMSLVLKTVLVSSKTTVKTGTGEN